MFAQLIFNWVDNSSFQYNVHSGIELIPITSSAFEESFQTLLSLNVYNKFLDFLFIFPVQVLEDERIDVYGTLKPERRKYDIWTFLVV